MELLWYKKINEGKDTGLKSLCLFSGYFHLVFTKKLPAKREIDKKYCFIIMHIFFTSNEAVNFQENNTHSVFQILAQNCILGAQIVMTSLMNTKRKQWFLGSIFETGYKKR